MTQRRDRNLLFPVVLALLLTGGAALLCLRRPWWTAEVASVPIGAVTVTGADVAVGATGLTVLVLASAVGVLAAGPRLRRWVGGLVVLAGAGGAVLVAGAGGRAAEARRRAIDAAGASGATDVDWTGGPWAAITAVVFVLAAITGLVVAARGGRWPTMGGRYDAPATRATDPTDLWKAMDDGVDPTV